MGHSESNKATQEANDKVMKYHIDRMAELGLKPNPTNIAKYLLDYAKSGEITKASWHKLRFQVLEQQRRNGYDTRPLDYENLKKTLEEVDWKTKPRNPRGKVKEEALGTFKARLLDLYPDGVAYAFLTVCELTGCRPSEVLQIETAGNNEAYIVGKKKNKKHKSGLDRNLKLKNLDDYQTLKRQLEFLKNYTKKGKALTPATLIKKAQNDIYNFSEINPKLPKITLKTMRHKMASDLKTARCKPTEIAAVLGHRSTTTQQHYGRKYKRSGVAPVEAEPLSTIRTNEKSNPYTNENIGQEAVLNRVQAIRTNAGQPTPFNLAEAVKNTIKRTKP